MKGSQSSHSGRNLETGAEAETMEEFNLLSYITQDHLPRHGTSLLIRVLSQQSLTKKKAYRLVCRQSDRGNPSVRIPSYHMILAFVLLTIK